MKCPTCGAENEASNRFCEQCGSRITPSGGFQPAQAALASMPTAAGPTCPSCGAAVLPGEAFCDECGASLSNVASVAAPAIANDAPTLFAQPTPGGGAPAGSQSTVCPSCGHQNLPGDRFCDNCGAELNPPAPSAPPVADATTVTDDSQAPSTAETVDANAATAEQPQLEDVPATAPEAPAAIPGADANAAQAKYEAEVARINEEVQRQQKIIEQFEQMQAMFGAATPPAVVQGLNDARDARARAEAELAKLTGGAAPAAAAPAPAPATAEVPAVEAPAAAPVTTPAPATTAPAAEAPAAGPPMPAPVAPPPPTAAPAAPRLVLDDGKELALPTDKREIIIGREDPISGIFPEVDLTPYGGESGGVSRQHARLNNNDGQWTLTDLNSTNYTRVDGAKIEPNVPVPIAGGAKLQFGRVALTFQA